MSPAAPGIATSCQETSNHLQVSGRIKEYCTWQTEAPPSAQPLLAGTFHEYFLGCDEIPRKSCTPWPLAVHPQHTASNQTLESCGHSLILRMSLENGISGEVHGLVRVTHPAVIYLHCQDNLTQSCLGYAFSLHGLSSTENTFLLSG